MTINVYPALYKALRYYKVYLAHPITGMSGPDLVAYYDGLKEKLFPCEVLTPITGKENYFNTKSNLSPLGVDDLATQTNHAILERDMWMVQQADIILVDLLHATRVSIGCCMELAVGHWLRKHTVVAMELDNIHNHAFVVEAADVVCPTLIQALDYVKSLSDYISELKALGEQLK